MESSSHSVQVGQSLDYLELCPRTWDFSNPATHSYLLIYSFFSVLDILLMFFFLSFPGKDTGLK